MSKEKDNDTMAVVTSLAWRHCQERKSQTPISNGNMIYCGGVDRGAIMVCLHGAWAESRS